MQPDRAESIVQLREYEKKRSSEDARITSTPEGGEKGRKQRDSLGTRASARGSWKRPKRSLAWGSGRKKKRD